MFDVLSLIVASVFGVLLGAMFFGGLWWTVNHVLSAAQPALWLLGSSILRTGVALAGFYAIGRDDWRRLLAALVGFIVARTFLTWYTREVGGRSNATGKDHAS
jgi:F1F0 ATPase subunit 2